MLFLSAIVITSLVIQTTGHLDPTKEPCAPEAKVEYFKVSSAFKLNQYLTLIGDLKMNDQSAVRAAIRIKYIEDAKEHVKLPYYAGELWPDITEIDQNDRITYAFSTRFIEIFNSQQNQQKNTNLVYLVQKINHTFVYDISVTDGDTESTFKLDNWMELYDKDEQVDNSGYLSFQFILYHFPDVVKVNSLLIYDIIDPDNEGKHLYFALVYTTEHFEGKEYYFRHKLRSEETAFDPISQQNTKPRLVWDFDENNKFCDQLQTLPSAVSFLYSNDQRPSVADEEQAETPKPTSDIHFAEFYGNYHQLMTITFSDAKNPVFQLVQGDLVQHVENNKLMFCKPIPSPLAFIRIDCKDYSNDDDSNEAMSASGDSLAGFWLLSAIISIIILILVLIAFGIYFMLSSNKPIEDHESADKNRINTK